RRPRSGHLEGRTALIQANRRFPDSLESRDPWLDRVGRFLTVPPSHTTGRTGRVPRRFLCAFNAVWRTERLISPCPANQAMSMAIFACGELARHHHPLPGEA